MMRKSLTLLALGALLLAGYPAHAQAPNCGNPPNMLIILDRSGSMSSSSKWTHAKNAINSLTSKYAGQIYFALMLFPGPGGNCNPGQVYVPIGASTSSQIQSTLNSTSPTGMTPLYYSMQNASSYLAGMSNQKQKYALLVSDGMPNCASGSAVTIVNNMRNAGIKTFVVGFGSGVDPTLLNNLAMAGGTPLSGGTKYYQANNSSQLSAALQAIGSMVSCCGNGVLDAGEKCEKTIPAGKPGACPKTAADCNDNNPCTTDYPSGSECNVVCKHAPVTKAVHGDKCCPPGANSNTDPDCNPKCGNGALESGELCDPGIKSGTGKCKTAADCDDGDKCTTESVVGSACDVKCQYTNVLPDPSKSDGCCPKGYTKQEDADCLPPCGPDTKTGCIDLCKGVSCPSGFYCYKGKCIKAGGNPAGDGGVPTEDPDGGGSWTDDPGNNNNGNSNGNTSNPNDPYDPNDPNAGFIGGEGCACHAAGAPDAGLPATLGLLLLVAIARRRRR